MQMQGGEGVGKRGRWGEDSALSPIQAQQDENMNPELCSLQMGHGSLSRLNVVCRALFSWLAKDFVHVKREKNRR